MRYKEREVEDKKEKGKMKRLPDPIYKERGNRRAQKSRRPKNDYPAARTPRSWGWLLKIKDLLRYAGYCVKLMTDDVMAGFCNSRR